MWQHTWKVVEGAEGWENPMPLGLLLWMSEVRVRKLWEELVRSTGLLQRKTTECFRVGCSLQSTEPLPLVRWCFFYTCVSFYIQMFAKSSRGLILLDTKSG